MGQRIQQRLTAKEVAAIRERGYHADGGGLYLQVSAFGTKSWLFRYARPHDSQGRESWMGLGPVGDVSLAKARTKAAECRELLADGVDPLHAKKAEREKARLNAGNSITFADAARRFIEANRAEWKNAKHVEQWQSTLDTYCKKFAKKPVAQVDTDAVREALEAIWTTKPETASRLRGRIERVLAWATVRKYRSGENPARWRGHLDTLLPKLKKLQRVKHHPALPFPQVSSFLTDLKEQEGMGPRALEYTILTATRTGEVIGARWDEIDLDGALWTIPKERMKAHREHRVPLSPAALRLLREMKKETGKGEYVFPGAIENQPLSNMAMLEVLRRMERDDLTVHGFRSTFRDWAAETTNFPNIVVEAALAHTISDKVEAAYRRGDLFDKRRKLMDAWATYCNSAKASGKVVALHRRKA